MTSQTEGYRFYSYGNVWSGYATGMEVILTLVSRDVRVVCVEGA